MIPTTLLAVCAAVLPCPAPDPLADPLIGPLTSEAEVPAGEPLFRERTDAFFAPAPGAEAGDGELVPTAVTTTCGSDAKEYILEVNGCGLALGDFDGDGWVDLLVVDGSTIERIQAGEPGFPPRLYLNRGADAPGTFVLAGPAWELAGGRRGNGVATGDLNGDGHLDLVITEWGADRVILNVGGRGFREITPDAGLDGRRWGTSAALFDFDGDGVLDLVVANYLAFDLEDEIERRSSQPAKWNGHQVMRGPEGMTPVHDQIYRGNGDGTFEALFPRDVGFEPPTATGAGFSLGVMPLDFDRDGDVDLYIANDSVANYLYENRFGEEASAAFAFVPLVRSGVAFDGFGKEQAGMGIASADINGDGRPDLLVTNFSGESNALYVSRQNGYNESATRYGITGPSLNKLGWGTGFGDFDLDGDLDAFVLNGHVYPQADEPGTNTSYAQQDDLYRFRVITDGGGRERAVFEVEPLSDIQANVSRAGACADLDNDGDLDIVSLDMNGAVRVLINTTLEPGEEPGERHWLRVRLNGRGSNTLAIGAVVELEWEGGRQTSEVQTAAGFQAAKPADVHVGLGAATRVAKLVVHWPGGGRTELEDVAVDRVLVIEAPEGADGPEGDGAGEGVSGDSDDRSGR